MTHVSTLVIAFLMLICALLSLPALTSSEVIVVDDDDGRWTDFTDIQTALDNASINDTIRVYAGTYLGTIEINTSVQLIGNGSKVSIVDADAEDDCVTINADWCTLRHLNVTGSRPFWYGIKSELTSNGWIDNCSVYNNGHTGIRLDHCPNYTISGNRISANRYHGIVAEGSYYGRYLNNLSIVNNTIWNHSSWGILLHAPLHSSIIGNVISRTDDVAMGLQSSYYTRIFDNVIDQTNTSIDGCIGIELRQSNFDVIKRNTISGVEDGVYMYGGNWTLITNNSFSNNTETGISINGGFYDRPARGHNFTYNEFWHNDVHAIHVLNGLNCSIHHNNFGAGESGRDDGNFWFNHSNCSWDNGTHGNYWSDYNGTDSNGDGVGDTPHPISGDANSTDRFPLMEPVDTNAPERIGEFSFLPAVVITGIVVLGFARRRRWMH